jgi:hypothetical protein
MKTKHTPTPWKVLHKGSGAFEISKGIILICNRSPRSNIEESEATGEFIVKACNNHDNLLKACKLILKGTAYITKEDFDFIRDAVKKATPKYLP